MTDEPAVLAIRYGSMDSTRARQYYRYETYGEADGPISLDYFFWVIRHGDETVLVDSGYHPDAIVHRPGRVCHTPPVEALAAIGMDLDRISTVVVTHFHFDHIGNLSAFPNARFVVQRREFEYWTGPHGSRRAVAASIELGEISFVDEAHRAGRVDLLDGDAEVAPGVSAILVGGHCPGQQVVRVDGSKPLIICSDALHFREEMDRHMPFNVLFDVEKMYMTYDAFNEWEASGAVIVPGHDPRVMADYPALGGADGLAVKLR